MYFDHRSALPDAACLAYAGGTVLFVTTTQAEVRQAMTDTIRLALAAGATRVSWGRGAECIRYPGRGRMLFVGAAGSIAYATAHLTDAVDAVSIPAPLLHLASDLAVFVKRDGRVLARSLTPIRPVHEGAAHGVRTEAEARHAIPGRLSRS